MIVKKPEQALDESTLINIFADCAAFRSMAFAISAYLVNDGHSGATKRVTKDQFKLSYASEHDLVILPYKQMSVYDDAKTALDWTLEQIKAQVSITL